MKLTTLIFLHCLVPLVSCLPNLATSSATSVNQTTCNGRTYSYDGLAGYGFLPSDSRDKTGDTVGGLSAAVFDSWVKIDDTNYKAVIYVLPDRGWNTQGTLNYQIRIHKFGLDFILAPNASASNPSAPNLRWEYLDTILLTGPDGEPTTGLRPDVSGPYLTYPGFPELPSATYTGNGFGQSGPGGRRISIDSEGLVRGANGTFWVSDEYGDYIYQFSCSGLMLQAIAPPNAYLPRRNGTLSFASSDPPIYDPNNKVIPKDVESGRANNQGLEGLTISPDGSTLYALTQSALSQDGGTGNPTRKQARLLEYRLAGDRAEYAAEYVVTLPTYTDGEDEKVAAQSEMLALGNQQFLVLARDSGYGRGQDKSLSLYRRADVFDISKATDIKGDASDAANDASIASEEGDLDPGITPAEYCSFLDFNVNAELAKFGLHNGGSQDAGLLNEKWEGLVLVPAETSGNANSTAGDYFLFAFNDNDFISQNGYVDGGQLRYSDKSGFSLDVQALVFKVRI